MKRSVKGESRRCVDAAVDRTSLQALTARCGIQSEFLDFKLEPTPIPESARLGVLRCMGFDGTEESAASALHSIEREDCLQPLPAVVMPRQGEVLHLPVNIPDTPVLKVLRFTLQLESGTVLKFESQCANCPQLAHGVVDGQAYTQWQCSLPADIPAGYHRLQLFGDDATALAHSTLICVPRDCFQPACLADGGRIFGISVQLYTLRSQRNWGMGDFSDLRLLLEDAAAEGIDIVGLNPLHALFPANPLQFSPYSPSNRSFLNVMYIDVEAVAEFEASASVRELVADAGFQSRLGELRNTELVDYAGVSAAKFAAFELLFQEFVRVHLHRDTARCRDYRSFLAAQGSQLQSHAIYDALHEHFLQCDHNMWGWPVWPPEYQQVGSEAVRDFARRHAARIEYFQYLQWCAHEQLQTAQAAAITAGMRVGIYLDLAVGADQGGSETWSNQQLYCLRASAGAPPDELARSGQDWGFPPFDPRRLRDHAYRAFIDVLRSNMALAGAVRFDHCVSLLRLWWIPRGASAADGAYVAYPLQDLLGLLALESRRNDCLVIGEDLGTVPKKLTEVMHENRVYSYRVLYFENKNGAALAPAEYPREAVATVSTHDLPTLASWWDESDIDLRASLQLLGSPQIIASMRVDRARDKQLLLEAMQREGYWREPHDLAGLSTMSWELNEAVHLFLASSRAAVMMSQIEDWQHMLEPVNVPGTFDEHPNWQRKVQLDIEGFFRRVDVKRLCERLRHLRPGAIARS